MNGDREQKAETRRRLFLEKVKERGREKRAPGEEEMMRVLWEAEERERRVRERVLADGSAPVEEDESLGK